MKHSILSIALLAGMANAFAQPMLVRDINPGTASSTPSRLAAMGKKLVFSANDGTNGFELWVRDTSGANLAFNINPASASSMSTTANRSMAMSGKFIYFPANNGTSGTELYRWDGTNPPMLAAEIWSGTNSSGVDEVISYKGKIYFDANDGINGEELWVYDTTSNTATRLTDVNNAGSSTVSSITVYDTLIYFTAFNNTVGTELYSYNPNTNSTMLVSDIEAGISSSSPNNLTVIAGKLYFTAFTTANGRELYSYNGMNVMRLTDIVVGSNSSINNTSTGAKIIAALGTKIYFAGNDGTNFGHLYAYDPANGNTALVYRTNPIGNSNINTIFAVKNKLYFGAENGVNGNELWMYNGTATPSMIADIYSGSLSSSPTDFLQMDKTIYFRATDSANGTELFSLMDSTLSIKNIAFAGNVNVYPNPTAGNVNMDITLEKAATLSVTVADMAGRVVYQNNSTNYAVGRNNVTIPMANAAAGVYIYSLKDEQGRMMTTGRLVKQ
ncbi:hypothetical protein CAP35_00130 [Chitinophagaceae bacterium IBVUCB1]|nr:hypothetical protein CAP35_00130 [Chitinophagaceae bacterium IBVUCB1]